MRNSFFVPQQGQFHREHFSCKRKKHLSSSSLCVSVVSFFVSFRNFFKHTPHKTITIHSIIILVCIPKFEGITETMQWWTRVLHIHSSQAVCFVCLFVFRLESDSLTCFAVTSCFIDFFIAFFQIPLSTMDCSFSLVLYKLDYYYYNGRHFGTFTYQ